MLLQMLRTRQRDWLNCGASAFSPWPDYFRLAFSLRL